MKRLLISASLIAGLFATAAWAADAMPLFVYVSPNPIGVNDFLKLGKAGAKVVVAIGMEFNDKLPEVVTAYPDVKFLQIDSCPFAKMKPNIFCSVFREHEATFLVGAEAALTSKTGKVGAIGALNIPFLHRFTDGFIAGAKQAKPDIQMSPSLWVGGNNPFSDPAHGQERAATMLADGADRVLAAGAGSNGGIFKAVRDAPGSATYGVDVNQCPSLRARWRTTSRRRPTLRSSWRSRASWPARSRRLPRLA